MNFLCKESRKSHRASEMRQRRLSQTVDPGLREVVAQPSGGPTSLRFEDCSVLEPWGLQSQVGPPAGRADGADTSPGSLIF